MKQEEKTMKNLKWFGAAALFAFAGLSIQAYGGTEGDDLVTAAGKPGIGYEDGLYLDARFGEPEGIAIKEGALAVADTANNLIRMAGGRRVVTQAGNIQGRDAAGYAWGGYKDSSKAYSYFNAPADCDFYDGWKLAVADRKNNAVRVIGDSWVYTIGGQGEEGYKESDIGYEALFSGPSGIAVNRWKKAYVADTGNHCIRVIAPGGKTSLFAGTPESGGFQDGPVLTAKFQEPGKLALAEDGTLYVCDTGNQRIRKIKNGKVTTLSGGSTGRYLDTDYLIPGYADGDGDEALFRFPQGICLAEDVVIVADTGNHAIRAIAPSGETRTIAGTGEAGFSEGQPKEAQLYSPSDVAWEDGILYICDTGNSALRTMRFEPQKWLDSLEQE